MNLETMPVSFPDEWNLEWTGGRLWDTQRIGDLARVRPGSGDGRFFNVRNQRWLSNMLVAFTLPAPCSMLINRISFTVYRPGPADSRAVLPFLSERSSLQALYDITEGAIFELTVGQRYYTTGPLWDGDVVRRPRGKQRSRRRFLHEMRHPVEPPIYIPPLVGFWLNVTFPRAPHSRFHDFRLSAILSGPYARPVQ